MAEEPRRFHAASQRALNLARGDTLFRGAKQLDDLEPDMQRDVARLKHVPDFDRERLAAGAAIPEARPRRFCPLNGSPRLSRRNVDKPDRLATAGLRRKRWRLPRWRNARRLDPARAPDGGIAIEGDVTNVSGAPQKVPELRLALRAAAGKEVQFKFVDPPEGELAPVGSNTSRRRSRIRRRRQPALS